jgi:hypothetical protein
MYDIHNNIKVLGDSVTRATDNTAIVVTLDRTDHLSVEWLIALGTVADADATFTALVEDSADNSVWAAVADDYLLGTEAGLGLAFDDDNKTGKIGYAGAKRYVRLTLTPANNTGNADIAIIGLGGHPRVAPETTQTV